MAKKRSKHRARGLVRFVPTLLITAAILLSYTAWLVLEQPGKSEQYAVWSSYLNLADHGDSHDLPGRPTLTVIKNRTLALGSDRGIIGRLSSFCSEVSHARRIDGLGASTFLSFLLMNLRVRTIERRFLLPGNYAIADHHETESTDFQKTFPNSYGYVVLSSVGFNAEHTEAYFYVEHICGLCGSGRYVLLQKTERGDWQIADEQYTWIS
jgi:hypothetical protein